MKVPRSRGSATSLTAPAPMEITAEPPVAWEIGRLGGWGLVGVGEFITIRRKKESRGRRGAEQRQLQRPIFLPSRTKDERERTCNALSTNNSQYALVGINAKPMLAPMYTISVPT